MVVTGFEPLDLVQGILMTVRQLEEGTHAVENAYTRVVTFEGNQAAQAMIKQVFQPCDRNWRGIGLIPMSGWELRQEYADLDAEKRFQVEHIHTQESPICIAGQILQGLKKPAAMPGFRYIVHAADPPGRADGLFRRGLFRLLPLRQGPCLRRCQFLRTDPKKSGNHFLIVKICAFTYKKVNL